MTLQNRMTRHLWTAALIILLAAGLDGDQHENDWKRVFVFDQ